MAYPSIEEYQVLVQNPRTTFTDSQLAGGKIATSGMGTPKVVSGGFALTYSLSSGSSTYAVRCFHKEAQGLERRYSAISQALSSLSSAYFVQFEYQQKGVRSGTGLHPLVKMAWAAGTTLGDFVETHYADAPMLRSLVVALGRLATYLEQSGIAHGDIQEGNLMVSDGGRRIQLIDYDGMYVPALAHLGGVELGHRDYQHPKRDATHYDNTLDRFSFIALNLALRALCEKPNLWDESQSGAGVILMRANDFADPGSSAILASMSRISGMEQDVRNFISICAARFESIPTLTNFLIGRSIPVSTVRMVVLQPGSAKHGSYISQYPVLAGSDYKAFESRVGQMVELVGRVVDVKFGYGANRKPFIFLNFGDWRKSSVKIALWSEALKTGKEKPTVEWVGKWVAIRGLVEPVFRKGYESISITPTTLAQLSLITDSEAQYRLSPPTHGGIVRPFGSANAEALKQLSGSGPARNGTSAPPPRPAPTLQPIPATKALSANQQALARMQQQAVSANHSTSTAASGAPVTPSPVGIPKLGGQRLSNSTSHPRSGNSQGPSHPQYGKSGGVGNGRDGLGGMLRKFVTWLAK